MNDKLYDPKVVAIGPFHHGKDQLCKMEQHKFRYLKLLLKRKNEFSVDTYVMEMRSLEEKARKCYAKPINFDQDDMTRTGNPDDDINYLIHLFIDDISPWPKVSKVTLKLSIKNVDHLLDLLYKIWCASFAKVVSFRPIKTEEDKLLSINSTSELQEAGIKFKNDSESNCLDIKFIKGVMKIPGLHVSDESETLFRNLIAYEQSFSDDHPKYVTDYAFFMHCLINSSKDVEALRRAGIITNLLGDNEMVYHMFNRIGRNNPTSTDFCYAELFDKVNRHSGHSWNRRMANLRHNYFNTLWAIVSFFAAQE
ncbi:Plant protein of unknown function [Forsythia ovata]|uniref:Uncharacterized protein n=1 Tax=Forsythia ovata TaxID=205694 RepID=A0ABD1VM49_9LAMI